MDSLKHLTVLLKRSGVLLCFQTCGQCVTEAPILLGGIKAVAESVSFLMLHALLAPALAWWLTKAFKDWSNARMTGLAPLWC